MMNRDEQQYIEKYILKNGERLDLKKNQTSNDSHFSDVQIIRETERTFRVVGLLTLLGNVDLETNVVIDEALQKGKLTPTKKLHLKDNDPNTLRWLEQGWIIKEIRFKKDGKTQDLQQYRMGYRFYKHLQDLQRAKEEILKQEFSRIKTKFLLINQPQSDQVSKQRDRGIQACVGFISKISILDLLQLKDSANFPLKWPINKRLKFLHFLIAFLQICFRKKEFDWKEIGANYYKEIGGSKEFDQNKEEFINQLEVVSECNAALLGMTSLGKITPLYFSGQITGRFSTYSFGPVHSLTDISIYQDEYKTSSSTLWLVENRAMLTRIASETNFLENTHSLMLCVDGHVRSSHKHCIVSLLTNSNIKQVIIWTDYDPDGFLISKELYETISKQEFAIKIKWISAEQEVLVNWDEYEGYMQTFLETNRVEQEEILGGAEVWIKWVHH